ncbi:MAG: hypothetical protein L0I29_04050 [Hyphomicrobiales bacterium]|nr:hypothetical protein [Hyphomicrobiales bacterium]
MNLLSIGLVAGLAATVGMTALKKPVPAIDEAPAKGVEAAAFLKPDTVFRLENAGGRMSCIVRKGRTLSDGRSLIEPGPRCAAIFAPLGDAAVWHARDDGTVDFIGRGGRTLVRFALADGAGYESIRPRSKILSLIAER